MAGHDPEDGLRRLATASLARDDPTGWFERLYAAAEGGGAVVPWDRGTPQQLVATWARTHRASGEGQRALVVGCGLGRDAELVVQLGYDTVAFDVSRTAISIARKRFPDSAVDYRVADLLVPPDEWIQAFDLVVESMTVQSLPEPPRATAILNVGRFVGVGGTLLVVAAARLSSNDSNDASAGPPWPLSRHEVDLFAAGDLEPVEVQEIPDADDRDVHRWLAEFRRT